MVDYNVSGRVAVLEINNPPVNALSYNVRSGLLDGIKRANADHAVQAVVIIGKGRTFPSGADIREFGKPMRGPWLTAVGASLESSDKPVVCAVHGTALGGGLEICLFSHYRIADKKARFGFPEVNIGLLPGGEGTVRLPRVSGVSFAMDLITSGRHISASEALKRGVIDKIVDGNLLNQAKEFALSVVNKPLDPRRLSLAPVKEAESIDILYENALAQVKRKQKGLIAPVNCLKSIRAGAKLPYSAAVEQERILFGELMSSAQSAALRYAFFADRAAPRWRLPNGASHENTKPQAVTSTAVIGAGTMGSGIAICLIRAGIPVILVEKNEEMLKKGLRTISAVLKRSVDLKYMTLEKMNSCQRILRGAQTFDAIKDVDLVIEAVFENLALKREIFSSLDKICKPSTLLCSNTSTLDIDKIASVTSRPDKVAGTHFFAPAHVMKLLENIYGSQTSATTVATIMKLGKDIGKIPVLVRTCFGFVGNRMNQNFGREASFIVEEGALPQDVDQVMEDYGMPMGNFKVSDLSGIDVGWRIRQEAAKAQGIKLTFDTRFINGSRNSSLGDRLYEMGRLGLKTGKGWYRYEKPMSRKAYPDPDVTAMILDHCKQLGIERRNIPPQEILERCLYSAVNEGFKVLEDGIAEKPEDVDVIWLYGFSFPRYRGGPMFYASQVGLKKVYERICHYHYTFPYSSYWVPSDLLKKLASQKEEVPINKWTQFVSFSSSKL